MRRYKFVAVWRLDSKKCYCNIECTRYEIQEDVIIRLFDGDLFVGQFDLGFVDLCYVTEVAA